MRRVLGDIVDGTGHVCVINDEAHHCYLPKPSEKRTKEDKAEDERAAVWFNTIRAIRDLGALGKATDLGQEFPVYDFSATPLWIGTASKSEPEQFQWVSSDFGLMDAIESGLVKVPRVPIDDDSTRDETIWRNSTTTPPPETYRDGFPPRTGQGGCLTTSTGLCRQSSTTGNANCVSGRDTPPATA